jgi:DNA-binding sugar fermentation-stimulating protein
LTISDIEIVKRFLRRFRQFARQLQHRHDERDPFVLNDEYDVQDVIHSVLRGLFDDIRTEEYVPSYAGGSSRMDFLLKKQQTVIEVKVASPTLRDKQIGEQLVIDIARYQTHPDCKTLICFIYDPLGHLRNPGGLEADLSKKQGEMTVMVIAASS